MIVPQLGERVTVHGEVTGTVFFRGKGSKYFEVMDDSAEVHAFAESMVTSVVRVLPTKVGDAVWSEGLLWRRTTEGGSGGWSAWAETEATKILGAHSSMRYRSSKDFPPNWIAIVVDGKLLSADLADESDLAQWEKDLLGRRG